MIHNFFLRRTGLRKTGLRKSYDRVITVLSSLLLLHSVSPLAAQTRFVWPDTRIDVRRYTFVEECLAVAMRVGDSIKSDKAIIMDTLAMQPQEIRIQIPSEVAQAAERCSARWNATIDVKNDTVMKPLIRLLLIANRDADVQTIIKRRFTENPPESDILRNALLAELASLYLDARPARVEAANVLLDELERLTDTTEANAIFPLYNYRMNAALNDDDSVHASQYARRIVTAFERLPQSERQGVIRTRIVSTALNYLAKRTLQDSLRRGTAGYAAIRRANLVKANDMRTLDMEKPIGQEAPRLVSDFWFPTNASTTEPNGSPPPRPALGRISFVVFLGHECMDVRGAALGNGECWDTYATIRRLGRRFPTLDIIISSSTRGFFRHVDLPTPKEEAEWLHQYWTGYHKMPVSLSISNTTFWRLPVPDRRRINDPMPNKENYHFGRTQSLASKTGYLIDETNTIVATTSVERITEQEWISLIGILLQRLQGRTTSASIRVDSL